MSQQYKLGSTKPAKINPNLKMWSPEGLRDSQFKNNPVQRNIRRGTPEKNLAIPGFLKKGGKVKKTGMAMIHKGEMVLPKGKKKNKKAPSFDQVKKSVAKTMGY